jgi:hypothetical protein
MLVAVQVFQVILKSTFRDFCQDYLDAFALILFKDITQ